MQFFLCGSFDFSEIILVFFIHLTFLDDLIFVPGRSFMQDPFYQHLILLFNLLFVGVMGMGEAWKKLMSWLIYIFSSINLNQFLDQGFILCWLIIKKVSHVGLWLFEFFCLTKVVIKLIVRWKFMVFFYWSRDIVKAGLMPLVSLPINFLSYLVNNDRPTQYFVLFHCNLLELFICVLNYLSIGINL